ncbi:MAG: hypothetical protein OES47_00795 [Acidobacteriota bacterium]|nr:hypothetical protein [Acidobacteriota bacterium]
MVDGQGSAAEPPPLEISCPKCGGSNPVAAGERFFTCRFCDTTLVADRSQIVGHFELPRLIDQEQAASALRRWMAGNETVKGLDRKSRLGSISATYFPMWLFRVRRGRSEEVFVEPAAPTPIPTLADLEVPAGQLVPYGRAGASDRADREEVPATIPLATARGWLEDRGVRPVVESSLVEVPLWRVQYEFEGRPYRALVEGSTGKVLATVFPEKSESPYYLVAGLGLFLFGLEGLLISNPLIKILVFGLTGLPLALLAYLVTRKV